MSVCVCVQKIVHECEGEWEAYMGLFGGRKGKGIFLIILILNN